MKLKTHISKLNKTDTYSLILFSLFKLRDIPEYSTLSELVYILDKDNILKLCEYFGGLTIKIPTTDELETIVYSLIIYQYVHEDNMSYDDAVKLIGYNGSELRRVRADYDKIEAILDKYKFKRGNVNV